MTDTRSTDTQWTELSVCSDCLMLVANGETDPNWTDVETADYLAAFDRNADAFVTVVPGSDHRDCTHDRDEDCPEDEGWFSWRPCDLCRRPLGGDRYPAMGDLA